MKKTYDTMQAWEKEHSKARTMKLVSYPVIFIAFALTSAIAAYFISGIGIIILFLACLIVGTFGVGVYVAADAPLRNIKFWKKRIAKSDEAIQEIAAGIMFEADKMGLEPVNKIEFRRKSPN
jgi:hypothetical protein